VASGMVAGIAISYDSTEIPKEIRQCPICSSMFPTITQST
jgi:hypothetical protein